MEHDTKQKILEVSKTLFYENGYRNTTVRQIADAVGFSTSVLFHHFINKKDIFVNIIQQYRSNLVKIISIFDEDLSPIDKLVFRTKLVLIPALKDENMARFHVDELSEVFDTNDGCDIYYPLDFFDFQDKTYLSYELDKYRYHYYIGSIKEIMIKFVNGTLPFDKKSIDHHILSCFNLFFNISIDEILTSIKRIDRVMNLIYFDRFDFRILNDKISEYIAINNEYTVYDQCKVILISDIIFSKTNSTNKKIELLKEKYNKVIVFTKNYKLNNQFDVEGILYSIDNFKNHILQSYSILKDKFENDLFIASFIDNCKSKESNEIIKNFETYGINAMKTLHNLNIHYDSNDNIVEQCAFIFYS